MLLLATLVQLASAACPRGPSSTVDVQRLVETAEFSFVELDDNGLNQNRAAAVEAVLCLGQLVHPPHAAAFLRLEGVYAFVNKNNRFALDALRSALTVQPDFQMRSAIAPPGGPLANMYEQARIDTPTMWALPRPGKAVYVNGISTTHAPEGLSIIQVLEPTGQVAWTGIVTGPRDLPPWFVDRAPAPAPVIQPAPLPAPVPVPVPIQPVPQPVLPKPFVPLDEPEPTAHPLKVPMLGAAGGTLLLAGGMYGGSVVVRGRYEAAPTAARRKATNSLFLGAAGAGIVSVGLAAVALTLPTDGPKKSRSDDPGGLY